MLSLSSPPKNRTNSASPRIEVAYKDRQVLTAHWGQIYRGRKNHRRQRKDVEVVM